MQLRKDFKNRKRNQRIGLNLCSIKIKIKRPQHRKNKKKKMYNQINNLK